MAANLLHSLADDNPDLQKHIGCMTGICQMFGHRQDLTGMRTGHTRISLGSPHVNSIADSNFQLHETNLSRSVNEKPRLSTESSRHSFLSPSSSSEFNKGTQPETSAFDRIISPETPLRDPMMNETSTFPRFGHQSLDHRDVVRDSMYKEARGLPTMTSKIIEEVGRCGKRDDPSRPYGSVFGGRQNASIDLKESCRAVGKLREVPRYCNNEDKDTKDGAWFSVPKDDRWISFDSEEMSNSIAQKLKELPRLSLDSRERVMMHNSNSDSDKGHKLSKSLSIGSHKVSSNLQESSREIKKRPPNVVANLMGLETFPGSPLASKKNSLLGVSQTNPFQDVDPFLKSPRGSNLSRPIRTSPSLPRSLVKDPTSPWWTNSDFSMKPVSSSRISVEPAPWKQLDRDRVPQKQASGRVKVPSRVPNSIPSSVYSEIEKGLKDLKFKHFGKDLRALKQILEAMQSKSFFENQKEVQPSNFGTHRDYEPTKSADSNQNQRSPRRGVTSSGKRGSSSSVFAFESPIVIMKPAKLVEKAGIPASSLIPIHSLSDLNKLQNQVAKDSKRSSTSRRTNITQSPTSRQSDKVIHLPDKKISARNSHPSSTKPQQVPKTSISKSSGSICPRVQQKKTELNKRSRPPTPPSDSSKSRRQLYRQMVESTSPGGKRRPKAHHNMQGQNDDQLNQISNESRASSHPGDDTCLPSDVEVMNIRPSNEIDGPKSPSMIKATKCIVSDLMQNKSSPRLSEGKSLANLSIVAPEHPSPISVLDTPLYREAASSPVKKTEDNSDGNDSHESKDEHVEDQWNPAYSFSETTASGFSPEINLRKLQNVEHLVQKLRRLNSTHDEASQDYIASLCENTNANSDQRYISEILLASGLLLRDLGSGLTMFQLHSSGHPINPELFLVLEQTKGSNNNSQMLYKEATKAWNNEKLRHKLVFDTVNDILVEKFASLGAMTEPWVKSSKLTKKTTNARQLLKDLCWEIEQLQIQARKRSENFRIEEEDDMLKGILWEDMIFRAGKWTEFNEEIPGVVLDVERLLFKDLVNEIVHGEAAGFQTKTILRYHCEDGRRSSESGNMGDCRLNLECK